MPNVVYAGASEAEAYILDLTPGDSDVDLSTVNDAVFVVRPRGASEVQWTATITNQTATTLTLTHPFDPGDIDVAGPYIVYAALTTPDGDVRSVPRVLTVKGRFEV